MDEDDEQIKELSPDSAAEVAYLARCKEAQGVAVYITNRESHLRVRWHSFIPGDVPDTVRRQVEHVFALHRMMGSTGEADGPKAGYSPWMASEADAQKAAIAVREILRRWAQHAESVEVWGE
jgi:hypothetical protein